MECGLHALNKRHENTICETYEVRGDRLTKGSLRFQTGWSKRRSYFVKEILNAEDNVKKVRTYIAGL